MISEIQENIKVIKQKGTFSDEYQLLNEIRGVYVSIKREDGEQDHYYNGKDWQATEEVFNKAIYDIEEGTWVYSLDNEVLKSVCHLYKHRLLIYMKAYRHLGGL